jgi:hypothetical protein
MSSVELKKWFFLYLACVNSSGDRGQALVAVAGTVSGKDLRKHNNKGKPDSVKQ